MRIYFQFFCFIFCIGILGCYTTSHFEVSEHQHSLVVVSKEIPQDPFMDSFLHVYKKDMDSLMDKVIGSTDKPMTKAQPESTIGNFMTDAQLWKARQYNPKVVASVVNYGGIRTTYIPPGDITKRVIYELMPFDNKLTVVEIPGKILLEFCDFMADRGGWPVSGISFQIKDKKAVNVRIGGEPINEHIVYDIVMSDYMANGGDRMTFLKTCKKRVENIFIRDVLIEFVLAQDNRAFNIQLENRIQHAE